MADEFDKGLADLASGKYINPPDDARAGLPDVNTGNLKETLNSPDFISKVKSFYGARDGKQFYTDDDARDYFLSDRRNRNLTDIGIGYDWYQGAKMSPEHATEQAHLQQVYDAMPIGTDTQGDRSVGGFIAAAARLPFNVTNIIPGGVGIKAGAAAMVKSGVAGGVSRAATIAAMKGGAIQAAKVDAGVNAALGFGFDALTQARNKEIGLQKEYSALGGLESAAAGAVLGGSLGAIIGGLVSRGVPDQLAALAAAISYTKKEVPTEQIVTEAAKGLSLKDIARKYNYTSADEAEFMRAYKDVVGSHAGLSLKAGTGIERIANEGEIAASSGTSSAQSALMNTPAKENLGQAIAEDGHTPLTQPILDKTNDVLSHTAENFRSHIDENMKQIVAERGGDISAISRIMSEDPSMRPKASELTDAEKLHESLTRQLEIIERMRNWPDQRARLQDELSSSIAQTQGGGKIPDVIIQTQQDLKNQLRSGDAEFNAIKSILEKGQGSGAVEDAIAGLVNKPKDLPIVSTADAAKIGEQTPAAAEAAPQLKFATDEDFNSASANDLAAEYQAQRERPTPPGYIATLKTAYADRTGGKSIDDVEPIAAVETVKEAKVNEIPLPTGEKLDAALSDNQRAKDSLRKRMDTITQRIANGKSKPGDAEAIAKMGAQHNALSTARKSLLEHQSKLKLAEPAHPAEPKAALAQINSDTPTNDALNLVLSKLVVDGGDPMRLINRADVVHPLIDSLGLPANKASDLRAAYEAHLDETAPYLYNQIFTATLGEAPDSEIIERIRALYGDDMASRVEQHIKNPKKTSAEIIQKMAINKAGWQPDGHHLLSGAEQTRIDELGNSFASRLRSRVNARDFPEARIQEEVKKFKQAQVTEMVAHKLTRQMRQNGDAFLGPRLSTSYDRITNIGFQEGGEFVQVTGSKISKGPRAFSKEAVPGTEENLAAGGGQVLSRERVAGGSSAPGITVRKATEGLVYGVDPETGEQMIEYGHFRFRTRDLKIENGQIVRKNGQKVYMTEEETALFQTKRAAIEAANLRLQRDPYKAKANAAEIVKVKAAIKAAKTSNDEAALIDLRAKMMRLTQSTGKELAANELERIRSNPDLIAKITSKTYEAAISTEQAAELNAIDNVSKRMERYAQLLTENRAATQAAEPERLAAEKLNEDLRGITARRAVREAMRQPPGQAKAELERLSAAEKLTEKELEEASAGVQAANREQASSNELSDLLKAAVDDFEATGDAKALNARVKQIMSGEELPREARTTNTKPVGKLVEPRIVSINGIEVDVNDAFKFRAISENHAEVNFQGQKVGEVTKDSLNRYTIENKSNGSLSIYRTKDAATEALPEVFWNYVKAAHLEGKLAGKLHPVETSKTFTKDWTNSKTYGRSKKTIPAAQVVDNPLPLPPIKIDGWKSNADVSILNFDSPADHSLAVMFESGGKTFVRVENVNLGSPQTVAQILGKQLDKPYAVGHVPAGIKGLTPQAVSKFIPFDPSDLLEEARPSIDRPVIQRKVKRPPSFDPGSAYDRDTGQAIFNRLNKIDIDQADLPERYRNQGLNTAADVYDLIVAKNNIDWPQINTGSSFLKFVEELTTLNSVMAKAAPEGVRLPNATRAQAMRQYQRIMAGYSTTPTGKIEVSTGLDFLRKISNNDADLPLLESGSGFGYSAPVNGVRSANRVTLAPDALLVEGVAAIPQFIPLVHELGHWAFHNVLSFADQNEFWYAMGKYVGLTDQNIEAMRAGRFDDLSTDLLNTKVNPADLQRRMSKLQDMLPGIVPEAEMKSPAEFFANQFSQWAVSEGKINNIPLWKKISKAILAIAEQFGVTWSRDGAAELERISAPIDSDLIKLFEKILPDDQNRYSRYKKLMAELPKAKGREGAASLAAHQLMKFDGHRELLDRAIISGDPNMLEANLLEVASAVYLPYGGNTGAKTHTPGFLTRAIRSGSADRSSFKRVGLLDGPQNLETKYYLLKVQKAIYSYVHENRKKFAATDLDAATALDENASLQHAKYLEEIQAAREAIGDVDESSGGAASHFPAVLEHARANTPDEYVMHLQMLANELDTALYYAQIKFRGVIKSALQTDNTIVNVAPSGELIRRAARQNQTANRAKKIANAQIKRTEAENKLAVADAAAEAQGLSRARELPNKTTQDGRDQRALSSMTVEQITGELKSMPQTASKRRNDLLNEFTARTIQIEPKALNEEFLQYDEFSLRNKLKHAISKNQFDRANDIAAVLNFKKADRNPPVRVDDSIARRIVDAHMASASVGVSDNGISAGTPAQLTEALTKFTHRNKGEEHAMRSVVGRLFAAMGKSDPSNPSPITADDITRLTGWKVDDINNVFSSTAFRNFLNEMRDIVGKDLSTKQGQIAQAESIMEFVMRASTSPNEEKAINSIISALSDAEREVAEASPTTWLSEQYGSMLSGALENKRTLQTLNMDQMESLKRLLGGYNQRLAVVMEGMNSREIIQEMSVFGRQLSQDEHITVSAVKASGLMHPLLAERYASEVIKSSSNAERRAMAIYAGTTTDALQSKVGYVLPFGRLGTVAKITQEALDDMASNLDTIIENAKRGPARKAAIIEEHVNAIKKSYETLLDNGGDIIERLKRETNHWKALQALGVKEAAGMMSPTPVLTQAKNIFDLSKEALYSTADLADNSISWLLDKAVNENILTQEAVDSVSQQLGKEFTGDDLLNFLIDNSYTDRNSMRDFLEMEGYDAIKTHSNEANTTLLETMSPHEYQMIDLDDPYWARRAQDDMILNEVEAPHLSGIAMKEAMETPGELDTKNFEGVSAVIQHFNVPSDVSRWVKDAMQKRDLTKEGVDGIRKFNGMQFTTNARRLFYVGADWLGNKLAPEQGSGGFYVAKESTIGKMLEPVLTSLAALPDSPSAVGSYIDKSKWLGETPVPDSHKKILAAMRRGPDSIRQLPPELKATADILRRAFDQEWEELRSRGISVGRKENYIPQVWDLEKIKSNKDDFIGKMSTFFATEMRNNKRPIPAVGIDIAAAERANTLFDRMTSESIGVIVHDNVLRRSLENHLYERVLNLNAHDLSNLETYLVNNIETLSSQYFTATAHKRTMTDFFGLDNHAAKAYQRVAREGRHAAVRTLMNDMTQTTRAMAVDKDMAEKILLESRMIPGIEGTEKEVGDVVDFAISKMGNTREERMANRNKAKMVLMSVMPPELRREPRYAVGVKEYEKRVDAIVAGLAEFGADGGNVSKRDLGHMEMVMNFIEQKPVEGTNTSELMMNVSRGLRNFNSITLLAYTPLASIPDVALPLIRSGNMQAWYRGWKSYVSKDPAVRSAARSLGVSIAHLAADRMSNMSPKMAGRFSNSFFHMTGQNFWHGMNREISALVGYEHFKIEIQKVRDGNKYGLNTTSEYRTALRTLKHFGLEALAEPGAPSIENVNSLRDNDMLRHAVMKFSNETQFQPNPNDIPTWAQTPMGALAFQLKSFPLMMARLSKHVLNEAGQGNIKPLAYLMTAGVGFGATALTVRDVIQARGGEGDKERALRNRNLSEKSKVIYAALDKIGLAPHPNDQTDAFLGWYVQGLLATGGLGMFAELLYNSAEQIDNGVFGRERITGYVFGPTASLWSQGLQVTEGAAQALSDTPENAKVRQALRTVLSRVPVLGGQKGSVEALVDLGAGEAQQ